MKIQKTNAMRFLDTHKIDYDVFTYDHGKDAVDGVSVASLLNQDPEQVFKTLVTVANTKEYFVFVIPVAEELDLKKAAKVAGVKNIEMIHVKDINKITGYIRGGCSPIGMKKQFPTFIHETCILFDTIMFSGGKIGYQISMNPEQLFDLIQAKPADIIK